MYKKRPQKRRAPKGKHTNNSTASMVKDNHASRSCITSYAINSGTVENFNHALNLNQAAVDIASSYQEFKIDYVEFRFKPTYDSFVAASGGITAGQLYYQILKDGSTMPSLEAFFQDGINATSLAKDGNITWRYKPSVVYQGIGGGPSILKSSPWINTTQTVGGGTVPNGTLHYGTSLLVDAATAYRAGQLDIEVHYKFRKPRFEPLTTPPLPSNTNGIADSR